MEATPWFRRYDDNNDDVEDFLDDFEEEYIAEEDDDKSEPITRSSNVETKRDDASAAMNKENDGKSQAQKRVTFQQDHNPPKEQQQQQQQLRHSIETSARHKLKSTETVQQTNLDANDASIPSNGKNLTVPLTRPVILHGRLVERAQPDYNLANTAPFFIEKTPTIPSKASRSSTPRREREPPIRDSMERRSIYYRLTSDTARLRAYVNALDDVIRQTTEFRKKRSQNSCSVSSISPSLASHTSIDPDGMETTTKFRLADVPRLLSTVPEDGEDTTTCEKAVPENAVDADPETFELFHHRNAKHINIAAWRVTNLVTQATALDANIWETLYEYEQKLRGNTNQQRQQQSACLKLHKEYRRVHRALKLCMSRLSKDGSIASSDDFSSMSDLSSAGTLSTTTSARSFHRRTRTPRKAETSPTTEETVEPAVPVSKVGWIGPKLEKPQAESTCVTHRDELVSTTTTTNAKPLHVDPPAPSSITARKVSRKKLLQDEDEKVENESKAHSFYISFIPTEFDSMVPSWKEDDTLTMYTLYEQHQEQWKKHIPWFLGCCGTNADSEYRDDFEDDTYRFDIDEEDTHNENDEQEESREPPKKWHRRYYPRRQRHLSLPKKPREAVF